MILKAMAIVCAAATVSGYIVGLHSRPPDIELDWGWSKAGNQVFDLRVTRAALERIAHGEILDVQHLNVGPHIGRAVKIFIDQAMREARFCRSGWALYGYSYDGDDGGQIYHFQGACTNSEPI